MYPNPADPLNPEAAQLMNRDEGKYVEKVKEYVARFASVPATPVHRDVASSEKLQEQDLFGEIEELDLDMDEL